MSDDKSNENYGGFSDFLGAIKGALFEDEPKAKPVGKVVDAAQPERLKPIASQPPMGATAEAVSGNNPMVAEMLAVVMSKTTAYTALLEAITPLEVFLPDESARYKAAYSIVGKTRTVDQIVQAIDVQHMSALDVEIQRFNTQARGKEDLEIASRKREVDALQASIQTANEEAERIRQQMEKRLAELQASSSQAGEKISLMLQEMNDKKASIARVNDQFNQAVATVKAQLTDAKAKVLRHLTE